MKTPRILPGGSPASGATAAGSPGRSQRLKDHGVAGAFRYRDGARKMAGKGGEGSAGFFFEDFFGFVSKMFFRICFEDFFRNFPYPVFIHGVTLNGVNEKHWLMTMVKNI